MFLEHKVELTPFRHLEKVREWQYVTYRHVFTQANYLAVCFMIIICLTNLFKPLYPLDYSKAQWNTLMVSNVTLFVEIPQTIGIAGYLD